MPAVRLAERLPTLVTPNVNAVRHEQPHAMKAQQVRQGAVDAVGQLDAIGPWQREHKPIRQRRAVLREPRVTRRLAVGAKFRGDPGFESGHEHLVGTELFEAANEALALDREGDARETDGCPQRRHARAIGECVTMTPRRERQVERVRKTGAPELGHEIMTVRERQAAGDVRPRVDVEPRRRQRIDRPGHVANALSGRDEG